MKKTILISLIGFLFISCEKEVFIGINESIISSFGKVFVSSNPQGYRIFIDDKNWNVKTPDSAKWISEGKHKLTLKHEWFSDSSFTFTLENGGAKSFAVDMMSNPRFYAKIICSTNPSGASIYLNDQPTGRNTPATITKVYPGIIEVKFVRSSCRDDSSNIKIKGGQYTEIVKILDDTSRGVDYRTINTKIFSDLLSKVVIDRYNNKWIGSIDKGLIKFDGKNWTSYKDAGVINSSRINDLLIDSKDRMWVASANGLSVYNGAYWQSYDDKLPSKYVTALEEDPSGNIWIGTDNGLVKYDNVVFKIYDYPKSGIPEKNIMCIAAANNGDIWFGTSLNGIVRFSNNNWIIYNNGNMDIDDKISNFIIDMTFDKNNKLWVFHKGDPSDGTRNALTNFDGQNWNEFSIPLQFPVEIVTFYNDAQNTFWISAKEGFVRYNQSKTAQMFNTFDYGFYSKHCTSSAIDKNGDAWITTMGGGLIKLKKANFN